MENKNLTKIEFYNLMKDYIGYGNPSAKIWIIGLEENFNRGSSNFDFKSNPIELPKESFDYYSLKIVDLNIYHDSSNILNEFVNNSQKSGYIEYGIYFLYKTLINSNIAAKDILNNVFVSNINFFPINKNNGLLQVLNDDFGISKSKFEDDSANRRKIINKKIIDANVKYVVFLGKTSYKEFLEFAELNDNTCKDCWDEGIVNKNGINYVFSYHPSNNVNKRFENRINEILNKYQSK